MIESAIAASTDRKSLTAGLTLLSEIPPLNMAVQQLIQVLSDDQISDQELVTKISACPSLVGKILGLANSAYFRRPRAIHNLHQAVALIGTRTVKSLAIASALQEPFSNHQCPAFNTGEFWLKLVITAQVAQQLSGKTSKKFALDSEESYLAGLLHNMGMLALVHLFPEQLNKILHGSEPNPVVLASLTEQVFGVDYLSVSAALLKHWNLPERFVNAAQFYASPNYTGADWPLSLLIGISNECAREIISGASDISLYNEGLHGLGLSMSHLEHAKQKCTEQLDTYKELAELIGDEKAEIEHNPVIAQATVNLKEHFTDSVASLSAIHALTHLDIQNRNEHEILDEALKILMEHLDMQRCSIFLNKESSLINVSGISWEEHFSNELGDKARESRRDQIASKVFTLGEGVIGMVAKTGEMRHAKDCSADPMFKVEGDTTEYAPGSLICVPLQFQDTVLGVLNVSHSQPDVFDEGHERFLTVFSNMLGQLIMFNRTFDDLETQIDQRTVELKSALEHAEMLSVSDELTGIHNRRYFISHFDKFIQQCRRYKYKAAVMMLDIDNFKKINDTYGHLDGDLTLIKVAHALTQCARNADIVARFGGEEFIVALQHTSCDDVMVVAERVLNKIRQLLCGIEEKYRITASIGVSCIDGEKDIEAKTIEEWIHEADQALYLAKHSGKDRIVAYKSKRKDK